MPLLILLDLLGGGVAFNGGKAPVKAMSTSVHSAEVRPELDARAISRIPISGTVIRVSGVELEVFVEMAGGGVETLGWGEDVDDG